jgi:hypothetical protein
MVMQRNRKRWEWIRPARGLWCAVALAPLWLLAVPAATAQVLDFEVMPAGLTLATLPGVTFTLDGWDVDPVVAAGQETTSGTNYLGARRLGAEAGETDLLLPEEVLTLEFDPPLASLSLVVVTTAGMPAGAIELYTPVGSTTNAGVPREILGSGDEVHPLSISATQPIERAELRSVSGVFAYHVDDLTLVPAPEPGTVSLLVAGVGFLALARRRRGAV